MWTDEQYLTDPPLSSPQTGILHSSASLGGQGIVVERHSLAAGEYTYPSSSSHMLCLHLGKPIFLEQVHNGRSFASLITPGNFQIVPAGTENLWRHTDASNFLLLSFVPDMLQETSERTNQQNIELLDTFSTRDSQIEHISSALLHEVLSDGRSGRSYAESLGIALAARLAQAYTRNASIFPRKSGGLSAPLLHRTTDFIEEHLSVDFSIVDLASEVGLSPSHFTYLFRKSVGLSPHQYIVQRRLEQAQQLLKSTRISISEIAAAVGFYDQSHLVRHLRRVMGVTPTDFRKHPF